MMIISDGSDLEGVTRVQDIKYIKLMRASLSLIHAWPGKYMGEKGSNHEKLWRWYILMVEVACVLPGLIYIKNNMGKLSFFDLGQSYITWLMNLVAVSRVILIFTDKYHRLVADFMLKMHLFHYKDKSEYAMKTHIKVHKLSHFFTLYIIFMCILGDVLFNLIPLYRNYVSGGFQSENLVNVTLQPSVYYALPFDSRTDYKGYVVVFIANWYISYICATLFCTFDALLSLLVFHMWGHLKILCHSLDSFEISGGRRENKISYTPEENRKVFLKLKEVIIHHQEILIFLKRMSDTFGYVLFIYYGFHQLSGCLLLLECSLLNAESLLKFGPLTIVLFQQLIEISIIFELLGSMGEKLADSVYSVPWELMDISNQKIVLTMVRQTNLSINVKALDMIEVGQRTMIAILKTTLSYFVMLRTLAVEN